MRFTIFETRDHARRMIKPFENRARSFSHLVAHTLQRRLASRHLDLLSIWQHGKERGLRCVQRLGLALANARCGRRRGKHAACAAAAGAAIAGATAAAAVTTDCTDALPRR